METDIKVIESLPWDRLTATAIAYIIILSITLYAIYKIIDRLTDKKQ